MSIIGQAITLGGSGGFELKVIGDVSRPPKATHNTLWVETYERITSNILSPIQPENPTEGMLWVTIGNSGTIKMCTPVGENWVTVYPISAKHYIHGEWVGVRAYCYQNGEWTMWSDGSLFNGVLFDNGSVNEGVTGGWSASDGATVSNTLFGDYYKAPSTEGATCSTVNKVDLTEYNTLKVNCTKVTGTAILSIETDTNQVATKTFTTTGVIELNISTVSGEHYISIASSGASDGDYTVDRVWLE